MNKPQIFRDEKLQRAFDEDGFVKFPMFSPEQVGRLRNYYLQTKNEHETIIENKKFHATNDTDNSTLIASADSIIREVMFEEVDKHFFNYQTIAANYLIKQPHEDSELPPHQDLLFVDEDRFYSCNIWVATEDTTKENGCLRFLKGSHRWISTVRPLGTYPWIYRDVIDKIPQYLTDVPTQIGDVVILNHACIHGSYPNLSGRTRIAAILGLIPQGAEIYHYFLQDGNDENPVELYAMTWDDFVNLRKGHRPEGARLIKSFKADFSPVSDSLFYQWLGVKSPDQPVQSNNVYESIKRKISAIFK